MLVKTCGFLQLVSSQLLGINGSCCYCQSEWRLFLRIYADNLGFGESEIAFDMQMLLIDTIDYLLLVILGVVRRTWV